MSSWDTSVGSRAARPRFSEPWLSHLSNGTTVMLAWQGSEQCPAQSRSWDLRGPRAPAPSGPAAPDALGPPTAAYGCRKRWKGQWLQTTRLLSCGSGDLKPKSAVSRAASFWSRREHPFVAFPGFRRRRLPWLVALPRPSGSAAQLGHPARSVTSAALVPPLTLVCQGPCGDR